MKQWIDDTSLAAATIISLAAMAITLAACPPSAQTALDTGKLVTCVLSHESETPSQIVSDCAKEGVQVTVDIAEQVLAAHRAATARERAAGKLGPCDGGVDAK